MPLEFPQGTTQHFYAYNAATNESTAYDQEEGPWEDTLKDEGPVLACLVYLLPNGGVAVTDYWGLQTWYNEEATQDAEGVHRVIVQWSLCISQMAEAVE